MGTQNSKVVLNLTEAQITGFDVNRTIYFWIISIISVIIIVGNLLTIKAALFRKYKYLQKTCIISLAVSDILTGTLFAMINLDLLSKVPMAWIYGEFLCHYLPVGQVLGNLTSSVALLVIAVDRYYNVIHALNKKWDPALWKCICGLLILWALCAGLSYPVATFYVHFPLLLDGTIMTGFCSGGPVHKSVIQMYYICMNCLFFIPIVLMFFWFYYKIAVLIWKHRKPPSEAYAHQEITETSSATKNTQDSTNSVIKSHTKKKNVQMERKLRSFKIVVVLIVAFIGCRLPYWFYMIYMQTNVGNTDIMWNIRFSCISLLLLNCALNPFLYTFLNFTIIALRKIRAFLVTTFCCWCSDSEFEDYEAGKPMAEDIMGVNKMNNKNLYDDMLRAQFARNPDLSRYTQKERY